MLHQRNRIIGLFSFLFSLAIGIYSVVSGSNHRHQPVGQHVYHQQLHQTLAAQQRRKQAWIQYKMEKNSGLDPPTPPRTGRIVLPPQAKAAITTHLAHAERFHRATTGLPGRRDTFAPQYGPTIYSGVDVRRASFEFHIATGAHKPKIFKNKQFPSPHPTHAGQYPVPHLFHAPTGRSTTTKEFPVRRGEGYLPNKQKGAARILVSPPAQTLELHFQGVVDYLPFRALIFRHIQNFGHYFGFTLFGYQFQGLISHDPTAAGPGRNSHYLANHGRQHDNSYYTGDTFII